MLNAIIAVIVKAAAALTVDLKPGEVGLLMFVLLKSFSYPLYFLCQLTGFSQLRGYRARHRRTHLSGA
jgi:hypothetical protein